MDKLIVSLKEKDHLEKAMEFIGKALAGKKISKKDSVKSELLAEETIVMMEQHASEDAELKVSVNSFLGDVGISLSMEGDAFEPVPTASSNLSETDDKDAEEAIRALFLKAYGEKYKYNHKNNTNKVRIIVEKSTNSQLYMTFAALVLGIVVGIILNYLVPEKITAGISDCLLTPIKSIFMNSLGAIVGPVVFFSMVTCISSFKNLSELGRLAGKIMLVYFFTTVIATVLAYTVFSFVKPGEFGFALKGAESITLTQSGSGSGLSIIDTIVDIVPSNIIQPILESDTLQLMFLAVFAGIAVGMIGEYSKVLVDLFEAFNSLFLTITTIISKFIPLAVFCSMALMMTELGLGSLLSVLSSIITQIFCIMLMLGIYGLLVLVTAHLNPVKFFTNIKEGMITSFSLCSSSASIPTNMRICKENLGVSAKISNFSIPLGATVNMDGSCIFLVGVGLFCARAYGIEVTIPMALSMAITVILLSLGAPGVPGCLIVLMGVLFGQLGIPMEAMTFVLAVTPILDMFDTMNNTTGDMTAALIVAKSEKLLDTEVYYK